MLYTSSYGNLLQPLCSEYNTFYTRDGGYCDLHFLSLISDLKLKQHITVGFSLPVCGTSKISSGPDKLYNSSCGFVSFYWSSEGIEVISFCFVKSIKEIIVGWHFNIFARTRNNLQLIIFPHNPSSGNGYFDLSLKQ